jgi:GMP synthase-like glutamine amidotransferase
MRTHCFQHVPFEGLGSISAWLDAARASLTFTRFHEDAAIPRLEDIDLLIVLGGPMSVNDASILPWLRQEREFIRAAIEAGKAVLGVCLGAQLIASALGARVYPNTAKEIGWFPVTSVSNPEGASVFAFPPRMTVFHWHGETFDLPPGAALLARSEACKHQAFQVGRRVIGLQFHLETTPEAARALAVQCRGELTPSRFVQSEREILSAPEGRYREVNAVMAKILDYVVRSF